MFRFIAGLALLSASVFAGGPSNVNTTQVNIDLLALNSTLFNMPKCGQQCFQIAYGGAPSILVTGDFEFQDMFTCLQREAILPAVAACAQDQCTGADVSAAANSLQLYNQSCATLWSDFLITDPVAQVAALPTCIKSCFPVPFTPPQLCNATFITDSNTCVGANPCNSTAATDAYYNAILPPFACLTYTSKTAGNDAAQLILNNAKGLASLTSGALDATVCLKDALNTTTIDKSSIINACAHKSTILPLITPCLGPLAEFSIFEGKCYIALLNQAGSNPALRIAAALESVGACGEGCLANITSFDTATLTQICQKDAFAGVKSCLETSCLAYDNATETSYTEFQVALGGSFASQCKALLAPTAVYGYDASYGVATGKIPAQTGLYSGASATLMAASVVLAAAFLVL